MTSLLWVTKSELVEESRSWSLAPIPCVLGGSPLKRTAILGDEDSFRYMAAGAFNRFVTISKS
ncbi:MAG: hypothetical protein NZ961_10315, partial [Candidatus Poribacteria bacterium]|nr:hypothetical protein [Candidatus Poribacteria bacterium]